MFIATPSSSSPSSNAEDAALHAVRSLDEVVQAVKAYDLPNWLQLQVRLRATADTLFLVEATDSRRHDTQLACRAFMDVVGQAADVAATAEVCAESLQRLQLWSARYVQQVSESVARVVTHGSELVDGLLRTGGGTGQARRVTGPPVAGPKLGLFSSGRARRPSSVGAASGGGGGSVAQSGGGGGGGGGGGLGAPSADSGGGTCCILTHGYDPYVIALLLRAARAHHFTILIAETRHDGRGHQAAKALLSEGVPVRMIEFPAVSRCMARVQLVLVGADAVLSDGGVLASVGTLTMAYAAHAHGRPLYVAAPQHVFCSTHTLDATAQTASRGSGPSASPRSSSMANVIHEKTTRDATPPHLVTLFLTDVGVLTPAAVADELLQRR
jgi:hypothetical protein